MTFKEFKDQYDKPESIVLLEGKRDIKGADKDKLVQLGEKLARETEHITFRSGNADGSDLHFSTGVANINSNRLEVITPYSGHRKTTNKAGTTNSLDDIDLAEEPEVVYQSKSRKKTKKLVEKYVDGMRSRYAIKAAYIIRDTIKVIGTNSGIQPISFGIFYDDLDNPQSGGTGHTMDVCEMNDMPFIDQQTWVKWITN